MPVQLSFSPNRAFDALSIVPAARVSFFISGTTTPITVFSDVDLTTPLAQPVEADGEGSFPAVWADGATSVKAVVTDASGAAIDTFDPVILAATSGGGADEVSFSPVTNNPATNVNDAILNCLFAGGNLAELTDPDLALLNIGGLAPDGDGSGLSGIVTTLAGAISAFAFTSVPTGWLECDGSTVSRTTYADLFAAIGDTFGAGDGSTTFAIPDLRGEFLRGWDNGRGVDAGRAFGSAQGDAFKSHNHTIERFSNVAGGASPSVASANSGQSSTQSTLNSGGDETRPRNIAMMYCIKF